VSRQVTHRKTQMMMLNLLEQKLMLSRDCWKKRPQNAANFFVPMLSTNLHIVVWNRHRNKKRDTAFN
jgi:hypothetical protein